MGAGRVIVGHPVDVGSGAVYTLSDDFVIPGELELRWRRHYSTIAASDTWLGPKWTVPYFMQLERRPNRYVLSGAHGEEVFFAAPAGPLRVGAQLTNLTANMELRRETDKYRVLHWHTGGNVRRFCFKATDDERMALAAIENLAGHRIRVDYDKMGRPARLVQELERRTVEISYVGRNLIAAVHFLAGTKRKLQVQYEYDARRRLIAVLDALGHRKGYQYDADNRMTVESNPLGSRFVFQYDRLGRCTRTAGEDGFLERKLQYFTAPKMTRVTDSRGSATAYYLNPAGQVVQIVDPFGGATTNTFDEHGRLIAVMQPDGAKESFAYDDKGNRATSVDRCGATTTVQHNDQHVPISMVDRNGIAWSLNNNE
jgi:YD repeat-containing protein